MLLGGAVILRMKYFTKWAHDVKSPNVDDHVIIHSSPIGSEEERLADEKLGSENHADVVTDNAMAFMVFLDPALNTPEVQSEIKAESFRRLQEANKHPQTK